LVFVGNQNGGEAVVTARGMVHRVRGESGQAMVEFVIVLPFLFALIFLLVYAGIGFNRQLLVTDAARVAARAGVVARFDGQTDPCQAARDAAEDMLGSLLDSWNCSDGSGDPGDQLTVTVGHELNVRLPFLPLQDIDLTSTATERLE
jgi:Flp pilus assembly protein TadG